MKAVVITGPHRAEVQLVAEPQLKKNTQIKIRVVSGAICNQTDNKVFATNAPEEHWPYEKFPFIIGHECSGYIVEKGADVKDFEVGDRIVYWTVSGKAFSDYLVIDTVESTVGKINESVSDDIAAIMEMVIGGTRYLFSPKGDQFIKERDRVVVFGLGPAGLIYIRVARLLGASVIVGIDMVDFRLNKAKELGADGVFMASQADHVEKAIEILGGKPNVIIDATGADVVASIVKFGEVGTRVIPFGVPPFNWNERKKDLEDHGMIMNQMGVESARYATKYCTKWANDGVLGLEPIITHKLPIEQTGHGLDLCRENKDKTLKVIIEINPR